MCQSFVPHLADAWKVCDDLRHAFCGPKKKGIAAATADRLVKLEGALKRREDRALERNKAEE